MINLILASFELKREDFDIRFKKYGKRYKIPAFSKTWCFLNLVLAILVATGFYGWYIMIYTIAS